MASRWNFILSLKDTPTIFNPKGLWWLSMAEKKLYRSQNDGHIFLLQFETSDWPLQAEIQAEIQTHWPINNEWGLASEDR